MKQTPKTHKTRCGAPWQHLARNLIAVCNADGSFAKIGIIDEKVGTFRTYCEGVKCHDYDLIPIPKAHNLPTDLPMAARYAFKLESGSTLCLSERPIKRGGRYRLDVGNSSALPTWRYGSEMLADYEPEDSLHERTEDGGWRKVG